MMIVMVQPPGSLQGVRNFPIMPAIKLEPEHIPPVVHNLVSYKNFERSGELKMSLLCHHFMTRSRNVAIRGSDGFSKISFGVAVARTVPSARKRTSSAAALANPIS